ncbi:aldehyde dehydrogenase family protein, partial [Chloroflexota bacterium]
MKNVIEELEVKGKTAKAASRRLAYLSAEVKNKALANIADDLLSKKDKILAANKTDCQEAKASGIDTVMLDLLMLNSSRLEAIAHGVLVVAALPDPVGEVFDMRTLPNGLLVGKKRVPFGVIGAIHESRPNVMVDISVLCLKSGNAVILRGGKQAIHSNSALAGVIQEAVTRAGMPKGVVQFIENTDRSLINDLLKMNDVVDLIIP